MSICKQNYSTETETALNVQINAELAASHAYLSMASYFARDTVALPGLTLFFRISSEEERGHARQLMVSV